MNFLYKVGDTLVFGNGEERTIASIYETAADAQRTTTSATQLHCAHRWVLRAKVTGVDELACRHCGALAGVHRFLKR